MLGRIVYWEYATQSKDFQNKFTGHPVKPVRAREAREARETPGDVRKT